MVKMATCMFCYFTTIKGRSRRSLGDGGWAEAAAVRCYPGSARGRPFAEALEARAALSPPLSHHLARPAGPGGRRSSTLAASAPSGRQPSRSPACARPRAPRAQRGEPLGGASAALPDLPPHAHVPGWGTRGHSGKGNRLRGSATNGSQLLTEPPFPGASPGFSRVTPSPSHRAQQRGRACAFPPGSPGTGFRRPGRPAPEARSAPPRKPRRSE